nr:isopentenyl-diphosphate Delta-isomerase [Nocardia carnea]
MPGPCRWRTGCESAGCGPLPPCWPRPPPPGHGRPGAGGAGPGNAGVWGGGPSPPRAPGTPHRAFSVLVFDSSGQLLLQQRALGKTRFPARWSNTCCGHPAPGQPVAEAAGIRLGEEMGLRVPLTEVGVYRYRAEDPRTGYVEHEWDHVLIGLLDGIAPQPDPAEVAAYRWMNPDDLRREMREEPHEFSPWFAGVLEVATARPLTP